MNFDKIITSQIAQLPHGHGSDPFSPLANERELREFLRANYHFDQWNDFTTAGGESMCKTARLALVMERDGLELSHRKRAELEAKLATALTCQAETQRQLEEAKAAAATAGVKLAEASTELAALKRPEALKPGQRVWLQDGSGPYVVIEDLPRGRNTAEPCVRIVELDGDMPDLLYDNVTSWQGGFVLRALVVTSLPGESVDLTPADDDAWPIVYIMIGVLGCFCALAAVFLHMLG